MKAPVDRSPFEGFLEQFKTAAAEGAVVELKLRLLADKFPELQKWAHAQELEKTEKKIEERFGHYFSEDDKTTLTKCRELRNKLLHGNFSVARKKLRELGSNPRRGGVSTGKVYVADATGTVYVADTLTTDPGGIYSWLLETGKAGDFQRAVEVFEKAEAILDRLAKDAKVTHRG
jgi:hypothetical protein